jgi:hypothetical protein
MPRFIKQIKRCKDFVFCRVVIEKTGEIIAYKGFFILWWRSPETAYRMAHEHADKQIELAEKYEFNEHIKAT